MSFQQIKEIATNKVFLTILAWVARVFALVLSWSILTSIAPGIVSDVSTMSTTGLFITIGSAILLYTIIVQPAVNAYQKTKTKAERVSAPTAHILDFTSLSTRESALHIPQSVPNSLRESVIWEAEMSGDTTAVGVERAAKVVIDRYRGGIPATDVADVLAIHESGHATVALALGRAVVGIKRDSQSGATYSLNQVSSPTSEDIWNDMILTVAGTQAEELWSDWKSKYPTNGHDDRSDSMGFVTILTFAGWSPDPSVNSDIDSLLRFAQLEARRILVENKDTHDALSALVREKDFVSAAEILEVAKKFRPTA